MFVINGLLSLVISLINPSARAIYVYIRVRVRVYILTFEYSAQRQVFMEWRAMMTETPYAQWELGAKASLDYWLMTKVGIMCEEGR